MRKKVFGVKLSRNRKSRKALFRAIVRALLLNSSIRTSEAKARAVVPMVERLFTKAKKGGLANHRLVLARLGNDKVTTELIFKHMAQVNGRTSGFVRKVRLSKRRGDNAPLVRLELVKTNKNDKKDIPTKA